MKTSYLFIFLAFIFTSCLSEDELKKPFLTYQPQQLNDGWDISSPEVENVDAVALQKIFTDYHNDPAIWQVRSLLVFRNGKLIAESYTKDDNDRTTPRAVWSCTKQVLGILTGIAVEKHLIKSIDDSISDYLSQTEIYADKKDITIRNLMSMKSGIDYCNDGFAQTSQILRQFPNQIVDFILARPLAYKPGEKFFYKDGDPQLVSACIQQQCGKPTSEWAKEVLFDKLNIQHLDWCSYRDGMTFGAFGIMTTPRELAKLGQLVLNNGIWKGNQIVSSNWITEMTTVQEENVWNKQFGLLWWSDKSRNTIMMAGHGGQWVWIEPTKKLVVVMTAEVNTQDDFQFQDQANDWIDKIIAITH